MESLMFYSNCALFIRWASFVLVRLIRRARTFIWLSFHSLSVFLLEWREFLVWITFIAAPSSTIVIEESALGVSQPFRLLCLEILNLLFIINKHSWTENTLHLYPVSWGLDTHNTECCICSFQVTWWNPLDGLYPSRDMSWWAHTIYCYTE